MIGNLKKHRTTEDMIRIGSPHITYPDPMAEWQKRLTELIDSMPMAQVLEWQIVFDEQGHAHIRQPYTPGFDNIARGVHGGMMATLLDSVGWCASSLRHPDVWVTTVEFSVHLLRPASQCDLHAEGWVVRGGKRLDSVQMKLADAQDGTLYATGSGTIAVLNLPIEMPDN